jgi:hypothetical protein
LRRPGRTFTELLTLIAKDPYHVTLAADEVEYLLDSGRAIVILDGLDELTDIGLRHRVVKLVDGFASLFPLTPVLVTSRRIGYLDAPLMGSLFHTAAIAPMDGAQVVRYATNWFALDDSTPPADRDRLREAFLLECRSIPDLCANPLLLSLLCAMYASEQYIPRNRAQVYERCAVMVFERWDSMRGIGRPLRFDSHIRGAVQELAWQMFAIQELSGLPRHRVLRILVGFLQGKRFDPDEARALAEEFLTFCTGRAWVLDEVGATDTEPVYGFAHRTFLEYFAAERLVRHHPSPEAVWEALRPHLGDSTWTVVRQLAVQLLHRNIDGGVERLVDLTLAALPGAAVADRVELTAFLAEICGQVGLSPAVITPIVDAAIDCFQRVPVGARRRFRLHGPRSAEVPAHDSPLWTLLRDALDANRRYLDRALGRRLEQEIGAGSETAAFLVRYGAHLVPNALRRVGEAAPVRVPTRGDGPTYEPEIWDIGDLALIVAAFDRYGPAPFYQSAHLYVHARNPIVLRLTGSEYFKVSRTAGRLRDRLMAHPAPWLPASWWEDWPDRDDDAGPVESGPAVRHLPWFMWPDTDTALGAHLILTLPYLETAAERPGAFPGLNDHPGGRLITARRSGQVPRRGWPVLPAAVDAFLRRWVRREISVIGMDS